MVTCFLDNHRGTSTFSVSNVTLELFLEDSVGSGWGEKYHQVPKEWGVARNGPKKSTDNMIGVLLCLRGSLPAQWDFHFYQRKQKFEASWIESFFDI